MPTEDVIACSKPYDSMRRIFSRSPAIDAPAYARHLAFFLALAEQVRAARSGPSMERWLACMDAERENILSAHRYCDRADNGAEAGHAARPSDQALLVQSWTAGTGKTCCRRGAVAARRRRSAASCAAMCCSTRGSSCSWLGRYDEAEKHLQESLSISREAGLAEMVPAILQPLGLAALGQGDAVAARAALEEALLLARQQEDKRELAAALNQVAQADRSDGRVAEAAAHYAEALSLAREIDDLTIVAVTLLNLAMIAVIRHAPGEVAPPCSRRWRLPTRQVTGWRARARSMSVPALPRCATNTSRQCDSMEWPIRNCGNRECSVTRPTGRFSRRGSRTPGVSWRPRYSPTHRLRARRLRIPTPLPRRGDG